MQLDVYQVLVIMKKSEDIFRVFFKIISFSVRIDQVAICELLYRIEKEMN
jgi:hypothetical protein